jgi:tetratricopeptide (TPR) repeat protein
MDAVTYPQAKVIQFITDEMIPLRIPSDHETLADEFGIKWTPALITLDTNGKEHHRTVGFMEADELIASLNLGMAKVHFDLEEFDKAGGRLEKLLDELPTSGATPEGIFYLGVSRYKGSGDPKPLREAYDKLASDYPDSEWTKKAYPYRLIE